MIKALSYSGHCAMHADRANPWSYLAGRLRTGLLVALLFLVAGTAFAAEAPTADTTAVHPMPVPVSTEAAQLDLNRVAASDSWLDEAVFTEISPLSIPEIGIALPADQAE